MNIIRIFLLLALVAEPIAASSNKPTTIKEIYEYEGGQIEHEDVIMTFDDYGNISDNGGKLRTRPGSAQFFLQSDNLEDYIEAALSGLDHLHWQNLSSDEKPKQHSNDLVAQFSTVNVPLFYGNDADRYGIVNERYKRSFFAIKLRRYYWGSMDLRYPIKHVILVAGGPGESVETYIRKLNQLSQQYGRNNLVFYVADHRGVYKSRDVVELVSKEGESSGRSRYSWRNRPRNKYVSEIDWIHKVEKFEEQVGFPLVAINCSYASKDLALISMILKRLSRGHGVSNPGLYYVHAQSYGTQVTVRALNILPNFYEAVLLEGLATMETVKESAKADFGILSSCAEDEKCFKMFSDYSESTSSGLVRLDHPFDLQKLLKEMASGEHNSACRRIFHSEMRDKLYSDRVSFWDALHLSMYELLADDFINPYTGDKGNFYPGMLVLFIIRDMYYCRNTDKFRRQVLKYIEAITVSVRGLDRQYVKEGKLKSHGKPENNFSYFVQTYINAHEAFDMQAMSKSSESSYCDSKNQPELVNQCQIWKEQVNKLKILARLSGKAENIKHSRSPKVKKDAIQRLFDGEVQVSDRLPNSSVTSDKSESSEEDGVDHQHSDLHKLGGLSSIRNVAYKSHKENKKKHRKAKKYMKKKDILEGIKWSKSFKADFDFFSPKKSSIVPIDLDESADKGGLGFKRHYYDIDELAYAIPKTNSKIYVSVGTLDVKTPLLEARKLLSAIKAPIKALFELKNVAHSTDHCRTEIIRAMVAEANQMDFHKALAAADECVRQLAITRKLDWEMENVKKISKEDWV